METEGGEIEEKWIMKSSQCPLGFRMVKRIIYHLYPLEIRAELDGAPADVQSDISVEDRLEDP